MGIENGSTCSNIWFGWPSAHQYEAIDEIDDKVTSPFSNILGPQSCAAVCPEGLEIPSAFSFPEVRRKELRRTKHAAQQAGFTVFFTVSRSRE